MAKITLLYRRIAWIISLGVIAGVSYAENIDRRMVDELMQGVKEQNKEWENVASTARKKAIAERNTWEKVASQGLKRAAQEKKTWAKVAKQGLKNAKKYAKAMKKTTDDDFMKESFTGYADLNVDKGVSKTNSGFYIFVSLGMPKELLKTLDDTARKIGARLIIRGLRNNSFKETFQFVQDLRKEGLMVDINPRLFNKFKIMHVPGFVMWDKEHELYDKLTGNVAVGYVLEEFANKGDTKKLSKKHSQLMRGKRQ